MKLHYYPQFSLSRKQLDAQFLLTVNSNLSSRPLPSHHWIPSTSHLPVTSNQSPSSLLLNSSYLSFIGGSNPCPHCHLIPPVFHSLMTSNICPPSHHWTPPTSHLPMNSNMNAGNPLVICLSAHASLVDVLFFFAHYILFFCLTLGISCYFWALLSPWCLKLSFIKFCMYCV